MAISNDKQRKLDIYVDINDVREYYNILKTQYQHKRWVPEGREHMLRQDAINNWRKNGVSVAKDSPTGWAITPHLSEDVCPPYPLTTRSLVHIEDRELIFGFAERLIEKVPMLQWASVTEMSPRLEFLPHSDWAQGCRTIHIPVISPPGSTWLWYENGEVASREHFDDDGSIWSLDTTNVHGVINDSDETRVHLLMIVNKEDLEDLYKLTGKI